MLSDKQKDIRILLICALLLLSISVYSQNYENETRLYDTTDYIPMAYRGAIDYNLMIAASLGYAKEIDRLISKGADVTAESNEGLTPLLFAVSNNRYETVKLLLEYGSDPNKTTNRGDSPLIIAVKNQNEDIAEALIRAGAGIDSADRHKATALHYAAIYDYLEITDILLYYDASTDVKSEDGSTPLLAAVWAGNANVTDLLIHNGANIESRDNDGYTPFLMAAYNGDTIIMNLLIKKGADIYVLNKANQDALTLTIIAGRSQSLGFLLKAGNKWANRKNALNPYLVAAKYQRKSMIKTLKDANIPGNFKYEIDQVDIMASTRFSLHDIYTGINLSFKEPYINGGIMIGFDTKLWFTRVLVKQSENTFYQYMDKGSVVYAGLFKNFSLTDYPFKGNFELSASLAGGYSFGNELKGTNFAPLNKFMVIPALTLRWTQKDLSFSAGAEYLNTGFYHTGPVWLRLGASYNIYFDNVRVKRKTIKWY